VTTPLIDSVARALYQLRCETLKRAVEALASEALIVNRLPATQQLLDQCEVHFDDLDEAHQYDLRQLAASVCDIASADRLIVTELRALWEERITGKGTWKDHPNAYPSGLCLQGDRFRRWFPDTDPNDPLFRRLTPPQTSPFDDLDDSE
jgi:hypothetical protein